MEYNSDYEVRLATLGALGGDTTKKYDSVYSIDLEILKLTEQGGGGGGGESNYYIRESYDELSGITGAKSGAIAYVKEYQTSEDVKDLMYDYKDGSVNLIFAYSGDSETYRLELSQNGNRIHIVNGRFYGKYNGGDWDDEWIYNARNHRDNNPENFPLTVHFNNGAEIMFSSVTNGEEWSSWEENKLDFKVYKYNGQFPELTEDPQTDISVIDSGYTEETIQVTTPAKGWFQYYNAVSGTNKWIEKQVYIDNLTNDELGRMYNNYNTYHQNLSVIRNSYNIWAGKGYNVIFDALGLFGNSISFGAKVAKVPSAELKYSQFRISYNSESGKWNISNVEAGNIATDDVVKKDINNRVGTDWETFSRGFGDGSLLSFAPSGSATFEVWSYEITKESSAQDIKWLGQFNRRNGSGYQVCTDFYNERVRLNNNNGLEVYFDADNSWQLIGYYWNWRDNVKAYGVCALKLVDNGSTMTLYMATSKEGTAVGEDNEFYINKNSEFESGWVQEADEVISYQPHLYQIYFENNNGSLMLKRHTLI